jgi:cytochrome c-type biogenesis protein
MNPFLLDVSMAVWFGILTSISPCTLATNITAISFIGKRVERAGLVFLAGLLYMAGRMLAYTVLGIILVSSTRLIPPVANFLQMYMIYLLGPALIVIGVLLLDVLKLNIAGISFVGGGLQARAGQAGIWGAGLLGVILALSFCPISAGLFFGSLFSLALQHHSSILFPALYGFGTALPVFILAVLLAFAVNLVGCIFQKLTSFEVWARQLTGIVFILVGLYLCFTQIWPIL